MEALGIELTEDESAGPVSKELFRNLIRKGMYVAGCCVWRNGH